MKNRNKAIKDRKNNVYPLRFKSKASPRKIKEPEKDSFSKLSQKIEERLNQIESEIKDSVSQLEHEVQENLKKSRLKTDEKLLKKDIQDLSQNLQKRLHQRINEIKTSKSEDLDHLKSLSSQLTQMLSFDFYKKVIHQLSEAEVNTELDPFGMDPKMIRKIKPLFDFLYYKYWRVNCTGVENIPNNGQALLVSNHSGTLPYDGSMIKCAVLNEHPLRNDARFLIEDFVYHMPFLGTFMYRIGGVRACPENAQKLLEAGHLVIVFPEGVKGIGKYYKDRYQLQRFGRGGFIKLCIQTQSPLVPVAVVGAEEIHPILFKSNMLAKAVGIPYIPITPTFPLGGFLGCLPLPTKWSIHFGEAIHFDHFSHQDLENDLLIHQLSEDVRLKIQDMIKELLQKRQSVFFG